MPPLSITLANAAGEPALGLWPSLVLAAVSLAIVVTVVVKLVGESRDDTTGGPDRPHADREETDDEPTGTEQSGDDVV